MFRTLVSFSAIGLAASIGCAPAREIDKTDEVSAVRQRYADWVAAEKRRDLEASMSFLAPEAIIQGEGAPAIRGADAARGVWKEFFAIPYSDIVDVEPRTVVVARSGDLAYDVGSWRLIVPGNNGVTEERGKSTIIWQRLHDQWKVTAIAFSMDMPPVSTSAPSGTSLK